MGQEAIWRLGAVCDVDDLASARVMERSGMRCEGMLRRWLVHSYISGEISGEPRDCYSYAIVR
jgi:RimJ/RimL family protein N-acetyltransferase